MGVFDKIKSGLNSVDPFNYSLMNKSEIQQDNMEYFGKELLEQTTRPSLALPYLSTDSGAKQAIYPIPHVRLYEIANYVGDVRTVIDTIQREMFKNGFKIKPKFQYRCDYCEKDFDQKPIKRADPFKSVKKADDESLECDVCHKPNFSQPKPEQRKVAYALLYKAVNANNQTLIEISRQYERDLDITDNAYCVILKKYYLKHVLNQPDGATKVIDDQRTEVAEFIRVHPAQLAFIADSDGRLGYDDNRQKVYVCPNFNHRNKKLIDPVCDECGARAIKAIAEVNNVFSIGVVQPKRTFYGEGELIWTSGKFEPDILYGLSPLISVWKKALALHHMDEYVWKYFDKQRPPRSLLIINSKNFESTKQMWERQRQGAREDPSLPRPILVENDKGGAKNAVNYIDLVGNLKDLEFTEVRKEFRQALFAAYGLPPFLFGQVDKGGFGGANIQMTETNRTIKAYQNTLKHSFFDRCLVEVGVTDWEIIINEGEETDEQRDEQLKGMKIDNASKLHTDLSFDVWLDGNGEPQTSQIPNPELIKAKMTDRMGDRGDKASSTQPKEEEDTKFQGEIHNKRPSDIGGTAQGDVNNGSSLNNKAMDIIRQGVENSWTQSNIAKKITNELDIPNEDALEIVKSTFRKVIA